MGNVVSTHAEKPMTTRPIAIAEIRSGVRPGRE